MYIFGILSVNLLVGGSVLFQVVGREFGGANIPRTIRFTDALYDELREVSSEKGISFNLLVLQCCRYALDDREEPAKKDSSR